MPARGALRRGLLTAAACAAAGLAAVAAGCGSSGDTTTVTVTRTVAVEPATLRSASLGARVFAEHCASCHGMNGRTPTGTTGEYGPNFDDVELTSRAYVDHRIEYGGYGMQSFATELTPDEREAVARYVLTGAGSRVREVAVPRDQLAQGRRVFEQHCRTCHSIEGRAATGRPTWIGTDFGEVRPSYDLVYEKTINGYYWWMPSFRDQMRTEEMVKALARYVEKVSGGRPFRDPFGNP
ncbi:c-type cytochrome [Conexibacter arvalis]|uniref:Mono/diheme cytochrome c family protein n=1 Tax=Conexibacter arvalis TaxID=912552 RepID=A0A840ID13_9ACTN|nr:c-type cytochrome [Conexibacter arvalis]MBB4662716.1 mono/diheme cytochrome c family protein [Conexibacter arvalis]